MTRLRLVGVVALLLLAIGLGTAANAQHGSFSAEFDVFSLELSITLEQQVGEVSGWYVYGGTGFVARPFTIEAFTPFTLACRELDLLLAFSELCVEFRVDALDLRASTLKTLFTTTW